MRILLLFLLFPLSLRAQQKQVPAPDEAYFRYIISALADDSMEGRLPGTLSEKKAADFIAREFQRSGCKALHRKKFRYPLTFRSPDSVTMIHSCGNVLAKIDTRSKYLIVISAHYDHIGHGQYHSLSPFDHGIYNGADDNASGVALLLGLASWCHEHRQELKYDLLFVAFSGEEDGLYGSQALLREQVVDTSKIICNLNFDMVGRLDSLRPLLRVEGVAESALWTICLPPDSTGAFRVQRSASMVNGGADNDSFQAVHIPAILLTTGLTSDYHKTTDDTGKINFGGILAIHAYASRILQNLQVPENHEALWRVRYPKQP